MTCDSGSLGSTVDFLSQTRLVAVMRASVRIGAVLHPSRARRTRGWHRPPVAPRWPNRAASGLRGAVPSSSASRSLLPQTNPIGPSPFRLLTQQQGFRIAAATSFPRVPPPGARGVLPRSLVSVSTFVEGRSLMSALSLNQRTSRSMSGRSEKCQCGGLVAPRRLPVYPAVNGHSQDRRACLKAARLGSSRFLRHY
jgi:hypothetical protein